MTRDGHARRHNLPLREPFDPYGGRFVEHSGFIGSPAMNFIAGRLASEGGLSCVESAGVRLPLGRRPDCPDGQALIYGIRPEHLALAGRGAGLPAIVEVVEPTGASTYVSARVAGAPISAALAERRNPAPGSTLALYPQLEHVHLFDAETGKRLG